MNDYLFEETNHHAFFIKIGIPPIAYAAARRMLRQFGAFAFGSQNLSSASKSQLHFRYFVRQHGSFASHIDSLFQKLSQRGTKLIQQNMLDNMFC